jgi:hypothetical protein
VLAKKLHEAVHPIERLQRVFHVGRILSQHLRDDGRVELDTLNSRGAQEVPLVIVNAFHLTLDHAAKKCARFSKVRRSSFTSRRYTSCTSAVGCREWPSRSRRSRTRAT